MFKGSIEQRRLSKQQARGVLSRACIFVWDTDLQNDEDENIGISQELFIAICRLKGVKSWDIPTLQFEKSWDIPKIGGPSNLGYPKFEAQKRWDIPRIFLVICCLTQQEARPGWGAKTEIGISQNVFPP